MLAVTLSSLLLAAAGAGRHGDARAPASPNAHAINDIYLAILGVTVTIFVLVGGFLLYSAIRFRERPGDPDPPQTHGSTKLELGWTIVPILIVVGIAGFTLYKMPSGGRHADGRDAACTCWPSSSAGRSSTRRREAPKSTAAEHAVRAGGQPVELLITSKDVIHDWWVPELGPEGRRDPRAARTTTWFKADRTGHL